MHHLVVHRRSSRRARSTARGRVINIERADAPGDTERSRRSQRIDRDPSVF
jgi:hypothetical protein